MASPLGRGAQVRLDGTAQAAARGSLGQDLDSNVLSKRALEMAGTAADGSSVDGSTRTGLPAEDELLVPVGASLGIPTTAAQLGAYTSAQTDAAIAAETAARIAADAAHAAQVNNPHSVTAAQTTFTPAGTGAVARTTQTRLREVGLTPGDFGAVGDGSTDDTVAMNKWWAALIAGGAIGHLPGGTYKCTTALVWDMAGAQSVTVAGAGISRAVIDLQSVTSGVPWLLTRTGGDAFYGDFSGFRVLTNVAGVGAQIGPDDYSTALNTFRFSQIEFKNVSADTAAVGLRVNYVLNSDFQVVTNTAGKPVHGTIGSGNGVSLQLRHAVFCNFRGSYSSAGKGIHLTAFYNFGNVFSAVDVEEVDTAVVIDSTNSQRNTFIGGTFVGNKGFDAQAGAANLVLNPNISLYTGSAFTVGVVGLNMQRLGAGGILDGTAAAVGTALGYTASNKAGDTFSGQIVVQTGGLTVTAGGIAVTAGGVAVTAGGVSALAGGITAGNAITGNTLAVAGAASGSDASLTAAGLDANVAVAINSKGTGSVKLISNNVASVFATSAGALIGNTGQSIGFYGATRVAKQTVTGSKGANAALASLITALANLGLVTDTST